MSAEEHRRALPLAATEPALDIDTGDVSPRPRSSASATTLALLAVVAALWFGQRFLTPVVAGLMLAMLLAPFVTRAGKVLRSPTLAIVSALLLFVVVLGVAASSFGGQLVRVTERVPEMISLAAQRLADSDAGTPGILARARDALHELDRAADIWTGAKTPKEVTPRPSKALMVQANQAAAAAAAALAASGPTPISDGATVALKQTAVSGSGVLLKFAGDLTIIVFVAFFVLAGGPALANRFIDQWDYNPKARSRAQRTLLECARQIRLYAGVLLLTNVIVGLVVWALFALSGLPDAAGWGVAAAVLHVVPYVGTAVLMALGAAETFLAHGTLGAAVGMAGTLIIISTLIGTLVTAWLQARAAKMNALTVFIGLLFWGSLWGIWGLFLGPALVVMLKVVAENSSQGQRLARLMQS